jgi:hypothetical protein
MSACYDIIELVFELVSIVYLAIQVKQVRKQTIYSIQIETLDGIYDCIDAISTVNYWPTCLSELDDRNIDNYKSSPHELEILYSWLTNTWVRGSHYGDIKQSFGKILTNSYTRKLLLQTKCLWPTKLTKKAIKFLLYYNGIQNDIKKIINGYGIDHPSPTIDAIFTRIHKELLPSLQELIESDCLKNMEKYISQ